jgi:hypothetical protein
MQLWLFCFIIKYIIFLVWLVFLYICTNFLNKMNGQSWIQKVNI